MSLPLAVSTALPGAARSLPVRLAAQLRARHLQTCDDQDREAGMTTAEYAVGTVAAVGFGGVLYKVITSSQVSDLLRGVVSQALQVSF